MFCKRNKCCRRTSVTKKKIKKLKKGNHLRYGVGQSCEKINKNMWHNLCGPLARTCHSTTTFLRRRSRTIGLNKPFVGHRRRSFYRPSRDRRYVYAHVTRTYIRDPSLLHNLYMTLLYYASAAWMILVFVKIISRHLERRYSILVVSQTL